MEVSDVNVESGGRTADAGDRRVIIRRVKGGEGLGGGERSLSKLSGIGAGEATGVLTRMDELLNIQGEALDGASGEERASGCVKIDAVLIVSKTMHENSVI